MPCASFSMLDGPGGTGCNVPEHCCQFHRDLQTLKIMYMALKSFC
jgi:hypothetical protein